MLTPVLALIVWTLIIWLWMYGTRIPAMQKAKINPQDALHPGSLSGLPQSVRVVADNYNHLHEQPVIFYALAFYTHLAGNADSIAIVAAWAYVALRVVHSLVQILAKNVTMRFGAFVLASIALFVLTGVNLLALLG
ncbi:MAG: MAPEG family protein [Marinicaulis sp.]|nr:MAPEG family protein [Marinicaulis sp.]NNE41907.1 MAPEG family protein [Marinicaulis sp.]NNL90447.1 MAPEG family protein [Marinicaulis sp.]